ncbi:uridine diphosphate-N-acetylglucosamine-binding protein YvcK [Zooshikella marina]|uniref:Putative gluconeogenesis factor n=1 Tax=Zooshikella ganghwensis TaxID=202772 RepID=A0A4P9VN63_9GAMM|nr:uridine diphosphate-N-acetylglucosamine-binding protein YvcK [Zooshikella ganghwensis]MBU2708107.1 uridine diphosphate-N-acetylglucosamine-binding protein YvcK [Zooshikella ganghwensis]RDH43372.1 uridine diphosphate-N-acetylglucosamine-binding protein YvcK [Zooshikella ganghwensis]
MGFLAKEINLVAIGGGHGLGKLMSALAFLGTSLTGIVATTDDGGSTGRLREESGCIAWGDLRNCLNQLAADQPNLARTLFEYRFECDGTLQGHNLGNLILLALDQLSVRPMDVIHLIRDFLQVDAQLIPMSERPTHLIAEIDRRYVRGETKIDAADHLPSFLALEPSVQATHEAVLAIKQANYIILGPGSFMTSIMPPLLLSDIVMAILQQAVPIIFVANMQPEKSSCGKLSLTEQLDWLAQLTKIKVDRVIWPAERTPIPRAYPKLHVARLGDAKQPYYHDKTSLQQAIMSVIQQY